MAAAALPVARTRISMERYVPSCSTDGWVPGSGAEFVIDKDVLLLHGVPCDEWAGGTMEPTAYQDTVVKCRDVVLSWTHERCYMLDADALEDGTYIYDLHEKQWRRKPPSRLETKAKRRKRWHLHQTVHRSWTKTKSSSVWVCKQGHYRGMECSRVDGALEHPPQTHKTTEDVAREMATAEARLRRMCVAPTADGVVPRHIPRQCAAAMPLQYDRVAQKIVNYPDGDDAVFREPFSYFETYYDYRVFYIRAYLMHEQDIRKQRRSLPSFVYKPNRMLVGDDEWKTPNELGCTRRERSFLNYVLSGKRQWIGRNEKLKDLATLMEEFREQARRLY